ncbi:MAG: 3-oxoacyl-[acyl-carrier-protein] reductase [candidate division KSB1 bacterium]|nr:3-oxoacyl-[acyl-carrier-protein] reductase [candidate division KSB1 bacterium]MDZ7318919.1 3-oxoacyl-[acyl-carrier-protein] reductase [candidate division KSB1 bacterium]MDZ7342367.1 3-oxoacyl-[acyl-carrier-protein] reductase [candidate division KSB1 bacterium]
MEKKVAIVTGSARGIGKAIAMALAQQGYGVVICDVDEPAVQATTDELKRLGAEALGLKVDVTKIADVEHLFEETMQRWGRVDVLVNNAGITRDNLLIRMSEAEWDAVIAVNLKGAFNCLKAAAKIMMKQRSGKIVNIASVVGVMGNAGQANYAASKGGLISLTKSAAKELAARNITVNAVAPGYIETEMTQHLPDHVKAAFLNLIPLKRAGSPEDVAQVVSFLVSPAANYITGQVLHVDGGMVM